MVKQKGGELMFFIDTIYHLLLEWGIHATISITIIAVSIKYGTSTPEKRKEMRNYVFNIPTKIYDIPTKVYDVISGTEEAEKPPIIIHREPGEADVKPVAQDDTDAQDKAAAEAAAAEAAAEAAAQVAQDAKDKASRSTARAKAARLAAQIASDKAAKDMSAQSAADAKATRLAAHNASVQSRIDADDAQKKKEDAAAAKKKAAIVDTARLAKLSRDRPAQTGTAQPTTATLTEKDLNFSLEFKSGGTSIYTSGPYYINIDDQISVNAIDDDDIIDNKVGFTKPYLLDDADVYINYSFLSGNDKSTNNNKIFLYVYKNGTFIAPMINLENTTNKKQILFTNTDPIDTLYLRFVRKKNKHYKTTKVFQ